jgi:2-pyrone-4,6-dicarboxylate lactonase
MEKPRVGRLRPAGAIVSVPAHRYDNPSQDNEPLLFTDRCVTRQIPTCKAPDPDTRKPGFRPPPGACDAHCHIFGPGARFPYAPDRSYTPPDAPLEKFRELQSILGLQRAVLVNASCHGTDNAVILDAIAQSNGQYRGVANADDSFTEHDFLKLHEGGCRGVRFNFVRHLGGTPDLDEFHRVIERIRPFGWHVVLHLDAADLVEIDELLRQLPVPFVIDHMGRVPTKGGLEQASFRQLLELARRDDCWVKISGAERISSLGPPFTDAVPFAQALIEAAPQRILWGTDWPHPNISKHMPNDGDLVDLIPLFAPDAATQARILVDNPQRLYGFDT